MTGAATAIIKFSQKNQNIQTVRRRKNVPFQIHVS